MKNKEVYVVIAYRFNNLKDHNYLVGVFSSKEKAKRKAEHHVDYRGGKYSCHIEKTQLDDISEDIGCADIVHIEKGIEHKIH